ncbi:MAG: YebC/PmpR family DNA-binding transcriptional regulator [Myxococcales bacterium]|nr:YebC/PmpR family DNA-binding transcriptional regulator [Myxococcales bacterium]
MAGHSKWANIKHKKAAADAKRGKVFSKIVKKIASAARRGGGDIDANPELRLYVDKARAVNMPNDNIERAILKATGQLEGVSFEEFSYEGYGPGGVAILLEGSTDNRNRTVSEIRHAFSKHGGNMGENGCVSWMFDTRGIFVISTDEVEDPDELMLAAADAGAEDFELEEDAVTITTEPGDFIQVRKGLEEFGITDFITDEITKLPQNTLTLTGKDAETAIKLIDFFEDYDDIESVYSNLDIDDETAEAMG